MDITGSGSPSVRGSSSGHPTSKQPSPTYPSTGNPPPSNQEIEAVIQMATSARQPAPPRDTRTQLFVGNLPYRVRWQDLKDLFRKAGTVLRADVSLGPDNRSRGYGTVLLATAEDAGRAIDMFNGYSWQTRVLEVRADHMPPEYDINCPFPVVSNTHASLAVSPFPPPPLPSSSLVYPLVDIGGRSDFDFRGGGGGGGGSLSSSTPSTTSLNNVLAPSSPTQLTSMTSSATSLSRSASRAAIHIPSSSLGGGSKSIFVGNLPFQCQWQDLKDLFRLVGPVVRADVALGPDGRSRGFGTVLFQDEADADKAVALFHGYEYSGRSLKVHHDKFTQLAASTSPPFAVTVPPPPPPPFLHYAPQHAVSYIGSLSNIPSSSHVHQQQSQSVMYPFHSQPTSPSDPYPPALPRHTADAYFVQRGNVPGYGGGPLQGQAEVRSGEGGCVVASWPLTQPDTAGVLQDGFASSLKPSAPLSSSDTPSTTSSSSSSSPHESSVSSSSPQKDITTTPKTPHSANSSRSPKSPGRPGTIAIPPPPPPSTFAAAAAAAQGGMMFSPLGRGLPPMTPSMPGFHFHPQVVSTPPGLLPHFLSPGIAPNSPQVMGYYRPGSYHATTTTAGNAPSPMGVMYAAAAAAPQHPTTTTTGHHVVLTPGPRLDGLTPGAGGMVWVPMTPEYGMAVAGPFLSPPITRSQNQHQHQTHQGVNGEQEYFPAVEPTEYFPPIGDHQPHPHQPAPESSDAGTTTTAVSRSSLDSGAPEPNANTNHPIVQAKVAGLSLDDEAAKSCIVNEIALASGLGVKKTLGGGGVGKWMSQKPRFNNHNPAAGDEEKTVSFPGGTMVLPSRQSKTDLRYELENPGLFALPSPGLGRRASWAEPAAKRPTVAELGTGSQQQQQQQQQVHDRDSR